MTLYPYLNFNGQAEEAATLYATLLSGTIENLCRYNQMPPVEGMPPIPAEWANKLMHCCLTYPGGSLSLADMHPAMPATRGNNIVLTMTCDSAEQTQKAWTILSEGALNIGYPLGEAFFAKLYGELTDRFGTSWAVMFEEGE